jgi:hypothetical protein
LKNGVEEEKDPDMMRGGCIMKEGMNPGGGSISEAPVSLSLALDPAVTVILSRDTLESRGLKSTNEERMIVVVCKNPEVLGINMTTIQMRHSAEDSKRIDTIQSEGPSVEDPIPKGSHPSQLLDVPHQGTGKNPKVITSYIKKYFNSSLRRMVQWWH